MSTEPPRPALRFRATSGYCLARSALLGIALIIIVLIAITGAGTEDQPMLLVFLSVVVGCFVLLGAAVAAAAWRLEVSLEGGVLRVRTLRTRSIDLTSVVRVGWRGVYADGPALVFAGSTDQPGRQHLVTLPTGMVIGRTFFAPAWNENDSRQLFPAMLAEIPRDAAFAEPATAPFVAAGCTFHEVD